MKDYIKNISIYLSTIKARRYEYKWLFCWGNILQALGFKPTAFGPIFSSSQPHLPYGLRVTAGSILVASTLRDQGLAGVGIHKLD